jgi:hypothetical protein
MTLSSPKTDLEGTDSKAVVAQLETFFFAGGNDFLNLSKRNGLSVRVGILDQIFNVQPTVGFQFHPNRLRFVFQDESKKFANFGEAFVHPHSLIKSAAVAGCG